MKQRIAYIDTAKALLIFLVVFGHVLNYANPRYDILPYTLMQEFISCFHMPAFFLLSGMLSDAERWKGRSFLSLLKSRCRTLLVPYVFFELLAVFYKHFILHCVSITDGLWLMLTLRCNIGADWYLPALFLANLLYWLYVRCPGRYRWIPALIIGFVVPCFLPEGHGWALVFRGLLGFGFLLSGALLKPVFSRVRLWRCAAAFVLTAVCAAASFKLGIDNGFFSATLQCPPLYFVSGVCGLYFVLGIARCLPMKWLSRIGENTLTIMGTHQLVLYTLPTSSTLGWVCGMLVLIAAVEFAVVCLTNRFCPALVGKKRKDTSHD